MDGFPVTLTEAVCLGASFGFSGLFYYLYKKSWITANKLQNAPHFTIDAKLKDLLKVTPETCLQYAVIEGHVKPVDEHLSSQFKKEIVGVLQKITLKEHRLVWSGFSHIWMDDERILHQRVNTLPFALAGTDRTVVRVLSPLEAAGKYTEVTYEKFNQASYGLGDLLGQYVSGVKPKGHLEIEEMLKVDTILTGVGELKLNTDGTLSLRPPSDGSQYFLSIADFDTLQREHDSMAAWWKALAVASALAGAAVLLWVGLRYYDRWRVQAKKEQDRKEFARLRAEAERQHANEAGPRAVLDGSYRENICLICLSEPRDCVLLDCGHVCCCYLCFQSLPQPKCPICRQDIVKVLPVYHP
ncbi:mitochondrial ubiquitin ligase activator of nfkb 1-A [Nothobranchius furzeri]|uniref:RING-type E3 ubiquitin transferase n=1 Tax=Nothobranchius furzeri TaxID=105023 RepID=A0A1A8AVY9_NOTFU|nr:mitochondrial ubiquitin ligase activator of nfkb 1-A [Nothobranchius furzeri]KAF7222679.1 mitochondrial ubiquitin ligase activator of nfkb 1-A-like [Nothobranchius furzeri]